MSQESSFSPTEKGESYISALETQEILLFAVVSLLRSLAHDSAKIRDILSQELLDYLLNCLHVLCKLVPRPARTQPEAPKDIPRNSRLSASTKEGFD